MRTIHFMYIGHGTHIIALHFTQIVLSITTPTEGITGPCAIATKIIGIIIKTAIVLHIKMAEEVFIDRAVDCIIKMVALQEMIVTNQIGEIQR